MVRVKLPLGLLTAAQLHAAGEVADRAEVEALYRRVVRRDPAHAAPGP